MTALAPNNVALSALGAVYFRERPSALTGCLASLARQTRPADEVILVIDGAIGPELHAVIERYRSLLPLRTVSLPNNSGLGKALNAGLKECRGDLVARFDTDDISLPERFACQLSEFAGMPSLDICGTFVIELEHTNAAMGTGRLRRVPVQHAHISAKPWFRNPFNHPTVMFKRESAIRWGGYVEQLYFEDFLTWQEWIARGATTANVAKPLVLMGAGEGFADRRGGWSYARHEINAARFMLRSKTASILQCAIFLACRIPVRFLPSNIRNLFYRAIRAKPAAADNEVASRST